MPKWVCIETEQQTHLAYPLLYCELTRNRKFVQLCFCLTQITYHNRGVLKYSIVIYISGDIVLFCDRIESVYLVILVYVQN